MNNDFKRLEEYFKKAESDHIEFQGLCHDCQKLVKIKVDVLEDSTLKVEDGAVYFPVIISEEEHPDFFVKCEKCYKNDPVLRDYQPVDCYSRVVGFYRPVKSWNAGKQAEWEKRKDYSLPKEEVLTV